MCVICIALCLMLVIPIQSFVPNPLSYARSFQLVSTGTANRKPHVTLRSYMTSSSRALPASRRNATRTSTASNVGSQKTKTKTSTSSSGDKVAKGDNRRNSRRGMHHSSGRGPSSINRVWRLFNVEVPLHLDPGKDHIGCHQELLTAVAKMIGLDNNKNSLTESIVKVVKKSFDGRWKKTGPKFVYTVDVDLTSCSDKSVRIYPKEGQIEEVAEEQESIQQSLSRMVLDNNKGNQTRIVIVGAGPTGLFAAIALAEAGLKPIIIERGQPVERRGRAIGALFNRKVLDPESNLCYGEGGAGTWSDGKLTTRIGKNSANVRWVLDALVRHGAPERILVDGKPHLGTDRLVRILKEVRRTLVERGVTFLFDSRVEDFIIDESCSSVDKRTISGLRLSNGSIVDAGIVVLSVGHSARNLYHRLLHHGVHLEPKPIAAGFRIEHPQELINRIQYGDFGKLCGNGDGVVPVADYRVVSEVFTPSTASSKGGVKTCYSFCMCPGGQIVPTSVNPDELCINGMSFSKRQSKWANSALVVNIDPSDMILTEEARRHDSSSEADPPSIDEMRQSPLRGVYWQEEMERRAAVMGGGSFVAPVQRVTDFLACSSNMRKDVINTDDGGDDDYRLSNISDTPSVSVAVPGSAIQSSYRLGVKEAPLHELYPPFVTSALHAAILDFDRKMPGFISPDAILHGVETRTSAPVQITRDPLTCQSITVGGLYPAGEGAGYAGGIMSAAVDGLRVAQAILKELQCNQ